MCPPCLLRLRLMPPVPTAIARTTRHGSPTVASIAHECWVTAAGAGGVGAGGAAAAGSGQRHVASIETPRRAQGINCCLIASATTATRCSQPGCRGGGGHYIAECSGDWGHGRPPRTRPSAEARCNRTCAVAVRPPGELGEYAYRLSRTGSTRFPRARCGRWPRPAAARSTARGCCAADFTASVGWIESVITSVLRLRARDLGDRAARQHAVRDVGHHLGGALLPAARWRR